MSQGNRRRSPENSHVIRICHAPGSRFVIWMAVSVVWSSIFTGVPPSAGNAGRRSAAQQRHRIPRLHRPLRLAQVIVEQAVARRDRVRGIDVAPWMVVAGHGVEGERVGVIDDHDIAGRRRRVGRDAERLQALQDMVQRDDLFALGEVREKAQARRHRRIVGDIRDHLRLPLALLERGAEAGNLADDFPRGTEAEMRRPHTPAARRWRCTSARETSSAPPRRRPRKAR